MTSSFLSALIDSLESSAVHQCQLSRTTSDEFLSFCQGVDEGIVAPCEKILGTYVFQAESLVVILEYLRHASEATGVAFEILQISEISVRGHEPGADAMDARSPEGSGHGREGF